MTTLERVDLCVKKEWKDMIKKFSDKYGMSISEIIRRAVIAYIKKNEGR